jgi:hypothetical protein
VTEAEWQECSDPRLLLRWVRAHEKERKMRLFGCHCCRRVWDQLDRERRAAVLASECYADGGISGKAWRRLGARLSTARTPAEEAAWAAWKGYGVVAAWRAAEAAEEAGPEGAKLAIWEAERAWQAALLRELSGNPFRPRYPLADDLLRWDDGLIPLLAAGIYRDNAFDRLPILADALLDAGCDNEELLAHCRSGGEHVRGCWALDAVLGR